MAAPAVSGIAAMVRSRHPKLSAAQVKKIVMMSGLAVNPSVILGGNTQNARPFDQVCRTGRIANLYNALILADQAERGQLKL